MSKADQLAAALDEFLGVSPDVEAAAVVSADGLPMASALPPYVEEDRLAAMSAALLTLGERAAAGLGKGDLAQVFVEGTQGYVVLMAAGQNAVLVAVTSKDSKVGLILYEMRKAASQIASVMDGPTGEDKAMTAMDRATSALGSSPAPAPAPASAPVETPSYEVSADELQPSYTPEPEETWQEPSPSTLQAQDDWNEVGTVVHEEAAEPASSAWTTEPASTPALQETEEPQEAAATGPTPPPESPAESDWQESKTEEKETRVTGWH